VRSISARNFGLSLREVPPNNFGAKVLKKYHNKKKHKLVFKKSYFPDKKKYIIINRGFQRFF